MYYLTSWAKYAWRWFVVMLGVSVILHRVSMPVTNPYAAVVYIFSTSFIAWAWYCKRVIEVVDVEELEGE